MQESKPPLISIVCLSFGRPQLLREALPSLSKQTYPNTELWVIDNRSAHSEEIMGIVNDDPKAKLLSIFRNRGYTGGMNTGLDNATGEYIFLTEDDVVAAPDCVEKLHAYLQANPETGLATGLMLNKGSGTIRAAGGVFRLQSHWDKHIVSPDAPDNGALKAPYFVNYIPGAMIFTKTSFLKELRGFRRDFFVYCEDDELCLRVSRSGRPIVVVPEARISHFEPPVSEDKPVITFHKQKNFLALYVLHAPWPVLWRALLRYGIGTLRVVWLAGGDWWVYLQARFWLLRNFPRLLLDRWQIHSDCRPKEPTA